LIKNQSCPYIESRNVASPTPNYFHRRKGCGGGPLGFDGHQTSYWATVAASPYTQFEEPRAMRCNCGINDNFLVISVSFSPSVQFWFNFAPNVQIWLLAIDSWVVQVMNLMTIYKNLSESRALPVCMGMFHNLLKVHCKFSNSLYLPLLLCLFTSSKSI
jgi:hypothetical protein